VVTLALVASLAAATSTGCLGKDAGVTPGDASCNLGSKQCLGDVPQICDADGTWHDNGTCADLTPVCNAGVCAPFRLRGGITTVGVAPPPLTLHLQDHGFEPTQRICGASGGPLCVRGEFVR